MTDPIVWDTLRKYEREIAALHAEVGRLQAIVMDAAFAPGNATLRKRNAELEDTLVIVTDELEHEINASYDEKYGGHPAMERRRERDLSTVRDARAVLGKKP